MNIQTLKAIQLNFYEELKRSQAGKKTSLPFIIHNLPSSSIIKTNEIFQAMVIGGSIFVTARVKKKVTRFDFLEIKQKKLPIFRTKEDFIYFVEQQADQRVRVIALDFAFPLQPVFDHSRLDGILLTGTKEHIFTGLIGSRIGLLLEEYFWKKYKKKITFAVANDTVCLLLSGLQKASWDRLAGGIVGTGVNFAFFNSSTELVNLESGNFDKFPQSKEGVNISQGSAHTNKGLFEKETSGAYLFQQFNSIIEMKQLPYLPISSTQELNTIALEKNTETSIIAQRLFKKSAGLVASLIAGITLYKGQDMTFVMEGSLFWKAEKYKEHVEDYLQLLIPDRKVNFVHIPNSSLVGAVKLVI